MLALTDLKVRNGGVTSLQGLEAAHHLVTLDLQGNRLGSFSLPSELTNLTLLDLSFNVLTNCSLSSAATGT